MHSYRRSMQPLFSFTLHFEMDLIRIVRRLPFMPQEMGSQKYMIEFQGILNLFKFLIWHLTSQIQIILGINFFTIICFVLFYSIQVNFQLRLCINKYYIIRINRMFDTFSYLYKTIKQEIVDQLTIFQQITEFYMQSIQQKIKFNKKIKQINKKLQHARNYSEWRAIADQHDNLPQIQQLLNTVYSPYYDYQYIQSLKKELQKARSQGQILKLISILRSHSSRNVGNITSHLLYRDAYNSTKKLIEEYQDEVVRCLRAIMSSNISNMKKLEFFGQLRHAVGRSALLLSGGAILGMYHIGVVQTLLQADCMPTIIAGSSAGSMIAALIATRRKQDFFDGSKMNFTAFINKKKISLWKLFKRVAKTGFFMQITVLKDFLKDNLGDITFQQAFDKYGYILNITVTGNNEHDEHRLLNYLTAPNVMIWSACAASCAIPFVYGATDLFCKDTNGQIKPYTLMNRKFLDGSIAHDLPMNKLSVFFNVNNFIVSQTNPWVIPFMDYTSEFRATQNPIIIRLLIIIQRIQQFVISEIKHRMGQMALVFPGAVTKFFNIATQSYVGNITIWPVPSLRNYLRILQNPTQFNKILNFVEDGRFRTYPKILQIKGSLFYEKQIAKCFKLVRKNSFIAPEAILKDGDSIKDVSEFDQDDFLKHYSKIQRDFIQQDQSKAKKNQIKYRNQSFLIPRQNSFS